MFNFQHHRYITWSNVSAFRLLSKIRLKFSSSLKIS